MADYQVFWGDTHHNTYQRPEPVPQDPPLDAVLRETADYLDFYAAAYYTPSMRHVGLRPDAAARHPGFGGLGLEGWKDPERIAREWAEVQDATRAANRPGRFVTFPGYEWQGDGTWGDHNVFSLAEGLPVFAVQTLPELYDRLRTREAIAVPHHIGYRTRRRAPDWSVCDERITPFAEIFSVHGCSETDEEWIGLRHNPSMGPGTGGSTWADALDRGLHLGAICSSDNWSNVPACYGEGMMACLAEDLTRESLWEAFRARRVYGVTGDRIALDFTVNGAPMGSVVAASGPRRVAVRVRGSDEMDRIEILRNNRVIATHCHQGTWRVPARRGRFKLRVEAGWGPKPGTLPLGDRLWEGILQVEGGRFTAFEPYRVSHGHGIPELCGDSARFRLISRQEDVLRRHKNSFVFEFEADPAASLRLRLNGLEEAGPVAEFCRASRVLWYRDECLRAFTACAGLDPGSEPRFDVAYHAACKAKLHRAMPESAFVATFEIEDDEPLPGETHYRVRVEQRNGQRAWSSPIWAR